MKTMHKMRGDKMVIAPACVDYSRHKNIVKYKKPSVGFIIPAAAEGELRAHLFQSRDVASHRNVSFQQGSRAADFLNPQVLQLVYPACHLACGRLTGRAVRWCGADAGVLAGGEVVIRHHVQALAALE